MGKKVKTRIGWYNVGNFLRLKGENFWRRVNSDGTLTIVGDGRNGTYDYTKVNSDKVKEETEWRLALRNSIDPSWGYPGNTLEGLELRKLAKSKQKHNTIEQDYQVNPNAGDSTAYAAWNKYLGFPYDVKWLPAGLYDDRTSYGANTVRLVPELEAEIPTDTTMLKQRIKANEDYANNNGGMDRSTRLAVGADKEMLEALRKTYKDGKPYGVSEYSFNSRKWGHHNNEDALRSPLNVLANYNIRYDKDTNQLYYSDEYGFDRENYWPLRITGTNLDEYLDGRPFRIRGAIDLNNK